jgi:Tfp pilus assembly protein PilO
MNRNRIFTIIAAVGMVGVLLAGWFLGISPQLDAAAADEAQRLSVVAQNDEIQAVVAQLREDQKSLPAFKTTLEGLQRSIPRDASTSAFIDDINALATGAGVIISGITVSDAQAYVAPESAAPAAPVEPTAAPAEGEPVIPVEEVVAADPFVPDAVTNPLVTTDNFVLVPITIESKGEYDQILNFVNGLQSGARLFLVTTFQSAPNVDGSGGFTGTTSGYIYVLLGQFDPTAAK